jgi:hypothetical protein
LIHGVFPLSLLARWLVGCVVCIRTVKHNLCPSKWLKMVKFFPLSPKVKPTKEPITICYQKIFCFSLFGLSYS